MSPTPKADYADHDEVYRRLRSAGASGWDSADRYAEMLDRVVPWLPRDLEGVQLLELGSGAGDVSLLLAARGARVHGVDIAPTAVAWARDKARERGLSDRATFAVDDVCALKTLADDAFEVVVDGHCLHCIVGDDRAKALRACHRVTKQGGVFVVLTMCGDVRNPRAKPHFDPVTRTVFQGGKPVRHVGRPERIVDEVAGAGFEIAHWAVEVASTADSEDDLIVVARKR